MNIVYFAIYLNITIKSQYPNDKKITDTVRTVSYTLNNHAERY